MMAFNTKGSVVKYLPRVATEHSTLLIVPPADHQVARIALVYLAHCRGNITLKVDVLKRKSREVFFSQPMQLVVLSPEALWLVVRHGN